nr:hypothetical protein [uncultured Amphritea sp.]
MKSYLFTTETDRGGVMLCDINDFDTAVEYLCKRFDGVVKIESAEQVWQLSDSAQIADETHSNTLPTEAQADTVHVESASVSSEGALAESPDLFG